MSNIFTPIDCDDDVVLLKKDTFKISRFKELANQEIRKKCSNTIYNFQTQKPTDSIMTLFSHVSIGAVPVKLNEIKFNSLIDCEILKIGGKGWQKGKLKIQICISPYDPGLDEVYLEFCPDEPNEPVSPLDNIRQILQPEQ